MIGYEPKGYRTPLDDQQTVLLNRNVILDETIGSAALCSSDNDDVAPPSVQQLVPRAH